MGIDYAKLDKLLCEKLNIPPVRWIVRAPDGSGGYFFDYVRASAYASRQGQVLEEIYPDVSSDGNWMLALIEGLRQKGKFIVFLEDVSEDSRQYWRITIGKTCKEVLGSLPQAVALTAAQELGIPIPGKVDYRSLIFERKD